MMTPRAATPDDFAFIRGLAGHPEYAPFITDEDETALALYLADPSARLQIWQENGQPMRAPLNMAWFFPFYRFMQERGANVLMGGEMGFTSDVGLGSRFWIDLPSAAPILWAMNGSR